MQEKFSIPISIILPTGETVESRDYLDIVIKGIYDENPKAKYPMITIQEIENSENIRFSTATGEKVSNLSYQIDCYSGNTENLQSTYSAMQIGRIVNDLLGGSKYKMTRIGTPALMPLIEDKTIIKYSLRYTCVLDLSTNTIYKN